MTHSFPPYPAYKNSGLPWLGQIPAHWETNRLKHRVRINASVLPETTLVDYEFDYLDIGAVGTGVLIQRPQRMRFGTAPSRARRILMAGDTIVSTVRTYLKAVYFISGNADHLVASTGFAVLTPRAGIDPRFVSYLAQSDPFTDQVTAESVGIAYPAIAETKLGRFFVAVPPLPEQLAIARYLAYHDALTRRYIRAKQKMIALLNEQKQAIIQNAVTRGLDPNVNLKPSSVEWLGEVPEHWEVLRSKFVFREIDNRSKTGQETHLSMSQKLGLIPSSTIEEHRLLSESYVGAKICEKDDLVLNRLKAHLGVFALAPQQGLVSPDYTIFRSIRKINPRYFELLLRTPACRVELRKRAKGIVQGFWRLYTDDFYDIRLAVPPLEEQNVMVAYLDYELRELNRAVEKINTEVELLREYRTRLIADVVTGKVDVRDAAAGLPEAAEEAAAEDLSGLEDPTGLEETDIENEVDSEPEAVEI